ncbi:cyclin-like protein [Xylariaceae sp. FL0662B]|nr:cyclin-like protein [Xylariaceae sp. FL0662B]
MATLAPTPGFGNEQPRAPEVAQQGEYKENLNQVIVCPDCREFPANLVEEFSSGDVVCASCGMVLGDRIIDTRSEWRTFANDEGGDDPSRVGEAPNMLLNGSQLETNIAYGEGSRSKELHRAQGRSQNDKATKSLLSAYREISQLCDAINIPKTAQDSAKHIFKLTEDKKFFKGKSQESIIAGCIFIACRQSQVPRTFREIYALTHVSKKEIGRTFKQLEKFLQNNRDANVTGSLIQVESYEASNSTSAPDLCARYCNHLDFKNPHYMEKTSKRLAEKSSSVKDLAGRSPLSVAAACIYMISHLMGDARTSKDIASVAGVSDGTIKTAYRFLYNAKDELVEEDWLAPKGAGRMDRLPIN